MRSSCHLARPSALVAPLPGARGRCRCPAAQHPSSPGGTPAGRPPPTRPPRGSSSSRRAGGCLPGTGIGQRCGGCRARGRLRERLGVIRLTAAAGTKGAGLRQHDRLSRTPRHQNLRPRPWRLARLLEQAITLRCRSRVRKRIKAGTCLRRSCRTLSGSIRRCLITSLRRPSPCSPTVLPSQHSPASSPSQHSSPSLPRCCTSPLACDLLRRPSKNSALTTVSRSNLGLEWARRRLEGPGTFSSSTTCLS